MGIFLLRDFNVGIQPIQEKPAVEAGCGMWDPHLITVYKAKLQAFIHAVFSPWNVFLCLPYSPHLFKPVQMSPQQSFTP